MKKMHTTFREYIKLSSLTEEEKREIQDSVDQIKPNELSNLGIKNNQD